MYVRIFFVFHILYSIMSCLDSYWVRGVGIELICDIYLIIAAGSQLLEFLVYTVFGISYKDYV